MKKDMFKWINICLIPVKLAMIAALIFFSYEGLNKVFYNRDITNGDSFRMMPENSIDVIVLGSSDSQYSFIPSFFYEDTGLTSYVRGTACQPLSVSYEMLKDSLKTQSPKMVILEVFTAMPLKKTCYGDSCFVIAQYQMEGDEKYETISYLPEEKANEYYNEFFNYHNDWRTVSDPVDYVKEAISKGRNRLDPNFGYVFQCDPRHDPSNWWYANTYYEFVDAEIDAEDLNSLNSIYELCESEGIKLLLYKTPIDGITVEDQSVLYKVWEWADDHDVRYYDFVDKSPQLHFYMQLNSDSFHCFISGANIVTTKLAEIVNDEYGFTVRNDSFLDYLYYSETGWMTGELIRGDRYARRWINRLSKARGYILLDYKSYSYMPDDVYEKVIEMGFPHFDRSTDYKAIIKNGELLAEGSDAIEIFDGETRIRVGDNSMHIGENSYKLSAPLTFGYAVDGNSDLVYFGGAINTEDGLMTTGF